MDTQKLNLTDRQALMVEKAIVMRNMSNNLTQTRTGIYDNLGSIVITDEFSSEYSLYERVESISLIVDSIVKDALKFCNITALMMLEEIVAQCIKLEETIANPPTHKKATVEYYDKNGYLSGFHHSASVGKTTINIIGDNIVIVGLEDYLANRIVGE